MAGYAVVKVVGVSFPNEDGSSRREILEALYDDFWTEGREGEIEVSLRREPDNPHDPNAVAVHAKAPGVSGQVGYVPRQGAEEIGALLQDEALVVSARVESMGVARNGLVGISVEVQANEVPVPEVVTDEDGNEYEFD